MERVTEPKSNVRLPRIVTKNSPLYNVYIDRTIMSPFVNQWSFYSQTSLEKLPRIALPLTEIPTL
jgi:hypothetical protein